MAGLYWLLLVPVLVPFGIWFATYLRNKPTLSFMALGASILAGCLVMAGMWHLSRAQQITDTEIWNGQVTDKKQVWVSCSHSYECFCTTDRDGNRTCQTCYEHSNDWDWVVYTTAGDLTISRVDRRGSHTPPRWAQVEIGEPASVEHRYKNYVQAVPESLYNLSEAENDALPDVPNYPEVYDYYRIDRVLTVGVTYADADVLNAQLNTALMTLGPQKQANVVVIVVNAPDPNYRYKVEASWIGGNKNDIIVLLGTDETAETVAWADVITFAGNAGNELFKVTLRDQLLDGNTLDSATVASAISTNITELYDRPEMADYEYLDAAIQPSGGQKVLAVILSLLANLIAAAAVTYNENRRGVMRGRFGGYQRRRW